MLSFAKALAGCAVSGRDDDIGSVTDCFFDERTREIRWFVVDTGTWLPGRRVLLPASHADFDSSAPAVRVDLSRQQVESSPHPDRHRPVSRQMETSIYGYYNWAPYWGAPTLAPGLGQPAPFGLTAPPPSVPRHDLRDEDDPHLRSAEEVIGYYVQARDGSLGHIEDLLVEPGAWAIAALAVDTKNWLPGRKVLLSAEFLEGISWGERVVDLACTRQQIQQSPEYDARRFAPVT